MSIFSHVFLTSSLSPQLHKMRHLLLGILGIMLLTLPSTGHAFETVKDGKGRVLRWKTSVLTVYVNPNNAKGVSAAQVTQVFQKVAANWNAVKCSKLVLFIRTTGSFSNSKDKKNVVSFPPNFSTGNIFQTSYQLDSNGYFTDIDIEMNPKTQWTTNPTGGGQDLESVAVVVLGHILGLASSKIAKASMYGQFLSGDIAKRTLHPDDIAGICTLYPSGKPQCSKDTDCPSGLGCTAAKCVEKPPAPAPKNCKTCASNSDCGSPLLVCDLVGNGRYCVHLCTPDGLCPTGFACSGNGVNAQCLPSTGACPKPGCTKTSDCSAGFKCAAGKCIPECATDKDCSAGHRCSNGRCFAPGTCQTSTDCPIGKKCETGKCVDHTNPPQPCKTDDQCPNGQTCQANICKKSNGCTAGATQPCNCSGGGQGTQTCASGNWGACTGCGGTSVCKAGETKSCPCATGGGNGTQTCRAGGKAWGACQGCGGTGKICAAGSTQACVCSDGKKGAQVCAGDGSTWQACKCTGTPTKLCTSGATQACVCSNGNNGTQTCGADGQSWGACAQCGGTGKVCAPGGTQGCVCTDGKNGSQSCNAGGTGWGQCQCSGTNPPKPKGETPPVDGGNTTPTPTSCTEHKDCPAKNFCVQNVCKPSGGGDGGCNCNSTSASQGAIPTLFMLIFFLGLAIRRRKQ